MYFPEIPLRQMVRAVYVAVLLATVVWGSVLLGPLAYAEEALPAAITTAKVEQVTEVRIVGNDTVLASKMSSHINTHVGRPFDRTVVQQDVRRLATLGWFVDVKALYETTPQGRVVIFQVVERPTTRWITYLGNENISDKKLNKETGLKTGGAVDPYAVEEGRRKIREYYQGRGFNKVQVTILEGTKSADQGIVYLINEGVSQRIWTVDFIGNEFVSNGRLKQLIKSKPPILKLYKGYMNREQIERDVDQLTAYYRSFGYFQAKVSRKLDKSTKGEWVNLTFVISEGPRYKIRNIKFMGNTKFEPDALATTAKMTVGKPFEQAKVQEDAQWLKELYGSHGYVFADVRPEPVFQREPGEIDLIYHIEEGEQFRVGRILVHIGGENPHTRVQTALNRMTLRPGDIMDIRELKASERRLAASSLFHTDPASGVRPKITYRIPDGTDPEFARVPRRRNTDSSPASPSPRSAGAGRSGLRGQSPDNLGPRVLPPPIVVGTAPSRSEVDVHIQCDNYEHYLRWKNGQTVPDPAAPSQTQSPAPANTAQPELIIRGQSPAGHVNSAYAGLNTGNTTASPYGGTAVGATGPASKGPNAPGGVQPVQFSESIAPPAASVGPTPGFSANPVPGYQVFPDGRFGLPGQPYPEQTVDIIFEGQETQTGRLMIGAGVNSNAGIVGNIVLDERNFDWRRWPRNFEDVRNGTAFRGAGQRFRIDASPGSIVNRYLVSFQEPYLLDTPNSLGLSGSLFDRRYRDWDEQRLGGRISIGRQWIENDLSATVSYRGESIKITDAPSAGAVPELAEVLGSNILHGFRLTVINDTRDSSFLPTQGHYLELSGEQVIGTFDYPRVSADYRKYFLLRERPDHSGRHVLSMATNVAYTGTQTPIYEHYFAGGFSTLRGFDFRGASPVDIATGVELGGEFQWLNSVQYLFPITADEMLHGVVFCDFGTVEPNVAINDFRVAPGVGLRVTVPAMGPAPIALDFAWAVNNADFDDREVFSFSMGFSR
ncbi:MAG: BamA/TamA family outer membrane protein [Planctomycetes bacterium]|nr:BamA/TamA family outer membrane protein [Planctomycetota bacterium]